MKTCPSCGYNIHIDGRTCPNCSYEFLDYDKNYRLKAIKGLSLLIGFMAVVFCIGLFFLTISDINNPREAATFIIVPIFGFCIILFVYALIQTIKDKDNKNSSTLFERKENLYIFDLSDKILDEIKFLQHGKSLFYNIYFTDKRIIFFYIGSSSKARYRNIYEELLEKNKDIEKLKSNLNQLVNYNVLTFSVDYNDINFVKVKRSLINFSFTKQSKEKRKKYNYGFLAVSFSRKNKKKAEDYLPIINKYLGLKVNCDPKLFS